MFLGGSWDWYWVVRFDETWIEQELELAWTIWGLEAWMSDDVRNLVETFVLPPLPAVGKMLMGLRRMLQ